MKAETPGFGFGGLPSPLARRIVNESLDAVNRLVQRDEGQPRAGDGSTSRLNLSAPSTSRAAISSAPIAIAMAGE